MTGTNWVLDQCKFLSQQEVQRLLRTARRRAQAAPFLHRKIPVRDYFIVAMALSTGLRVMEIAQLDCGDIVIGEGFSFLVVRNGKGRKKRVVRFNGAFERHCRQYLLWKRRVGEPTGADDPLLLSSNTRGHMTTRAIQKAFKRTAARAGLSPRYSIHCLRHTYACELYRAGSYNLRLVQEQLGHASCRTTEVYAHVMGPELTKSLERLYAWVRTSD